MATNVVDANSPNKSVFDETQNKEITINFGIFFDGTNNQRLQVAMGKLIRGKYAEKDKEKLLENINSLGGKVIETKNGNIKYTFDDNNPSLDKSEEIEELNRKIAKYNKNYGNRLDTYEKELIGSFAISNKQENETNEDALKRMSGFRLGMPRSSMQEVDFTNIARLEPAYNNQSSDYTYKVYISGSGTFDDPNKGVDLTGLSTGQGSAGVVQKVKDALNAIANIVGEINCKANIENVNYSFNVFGFSRGATEARLFLDLCSNRKNKRPELLDNIIANYNCTFINDKEEKSAIFFPKQKSIEFPFVGLFDTVSSVGIDPGLWNSAVLSGTLNLLENLNTTISKAHKQNKDDLGLDTLIDNSNVKHIVHICALDEYREYFALQVLPNADKVDQFFIPGIHTDIGGGDLDGYTEEKHIPKIYKEKDLYLPIVVTPGRSKKKKNLVKLNIDNLKELGWVKDNSNSSFMSDITKDKKKIIVLQKYSEHGYSFLPLNIMANKARRHSCSFTELKDKYKIPDDLPKSFSEMQSVWEGASSKYGHCYFPNTDGYRLLRQQYLHFSSSIKKTMGILFINAPNLTISNDMEESVLYYDRFLPIEKIEKVENKDISWSRNTNTGEIIPTTINVKGVEDFDPNTATNIEKGNFGEIIAHRFLQNNELLKDKGYNLIRIDKKLPTSLDNLGHQGIDGIYKNSTPKPEYVIIEVKYGESKLKKHIKHYKDKKNKKITITKEFNQMSDEWILGNERLESAVGLKEAHYIKKKLKTKDVKKVLINVDENGNVTTTQLDNYGEKIGAWPKELPI